MERLFTYVYVLLNGISWSLYWNISFVNFNYVQKYMSVDTYVHINDVNYDDVSNLVLIVRMYMNILSFYYEENTFQWN